LLGLDESLFLVFLVFILNGFSLQSSRRVLGYGCAPKRNSRALGPFPHTHDLVGGPIRFLFIKVACLVHDKFGLHQRRPFTEKILSQALRAFTCVR
jgi:hypothetical protein